MQQQPISSWNTMIQMVRCYSFTSTYQSSTNLTFLSKKKANYLAAASSLSSTISLIELSSILAHMFTTLKTDGGVPRPGDSVKPCNYASKTPSRLVILASKSYVTTLHYYKLPDGTLPLPPGLCVLPHGLTSAFKTDEAWS